MQINPINEHAWLDYYQELWTKQFKDNTTEGKCEKLTENCFELITMKGLKTTINILKSRKSPGSDGINNELTNLHQNVFLLNFGIFKMFAGFMGTFLKNGGPPLLYQYTKKEIKNPDNYRVISLLNTGYKMYSKIIAKILRVIAEVLILEEQNGFRKGRSCMDCIFSPSQITEKQRI